MSMSGILDTPRDKYMRDPAYKRLVDMLEHLMYNAEYSPSEIREAAMLACINHEMYAIRSFRIQVPQGSDADKAIETLGIFVSGEKAKVQP